MGPIGKTAAPFQASLTRQEDGSMHARQPQRFARHIQAIDGQLEPALDLSLIHI